MIDGKNIVAIIPARSGSLGLPGKNRKEINGLPLVMWSVEAAIQSEHIDIVVVSTNDQKIKEIVKKHPLYGDFLLLIDRPDSISGPLSTTESSMTHALESLYKIGFSFDIVVLLQPTSPLRQTDLIDRGLRLMMSTNRFSVLTVSEHTPFFFRLRSDGSTESGFDPNFRKMRQELQKTDFMYHDDGSFYACTTKHFSDHRCRIDNNPALLVNDRFSSFQIDDEQDFNLLACLMEEREGSGLYVHSPKLYNS